MSSSILYPYGNNSNNPTSRITTRISGKKNGSGGELDSSYAELLSEGSNSAATLSNGILSLSINDQKPRTPMDLIQVCMLPQSVTRRIIFYCWNFNSRPISPQHRLLYIQIGSQMQKVGLKRQN